jgi:hypothetical protein
MELARLVGDPKEVHLPSLQWRSVWVKVSCKNPDQIGGTSEVFINKKGRRISWFYSDKLKNFPPSKPDDDLDDNDDDITDEEDPESQESQGWLESGNPHPKSSSGNNGVGPSDYKGKQTSLGDPDNNPKVVDAFVSYSPTIDVIQSMHDRAVKLNPQIMMSQAYGCNQSPKWQSSDIISACLKSLVKSSNPEHGIMITGVSLVEVTDENSGMKLLP